MSGRFDLKKVLVDMEAGAKGFQSCLQPLHYVLLLRVVKAFVVHAGNTENHTEIAALGKEGTPHLQKPVEVGMWSLRAALSLPRLR